MNNEQPSDAERSAEIDSLLKLSDDELYQRLAEFDQKQGMPADLVRWGKEKYSVIIERARESVCASDKVYEIWGTDGGTRMANLISAIGDTITAAVGGFPVLVIATLIAREGLDRFCAKEWAERDKA